jgi:predicted RNA-binding Zn-ribbon protein involved in translation (DUF1610 family)
MKEYDRAAEGHGSSTRLSLLYWECPTCQTVNTEPSCENCDFQPEYYLPIDPAELVQIDENGNASDLFFESGKPHPADGRGMTHSQEKTWKCPNCGRINGERQSICGNCAASKPKRKSPAVIWLLVVLGIAASVIAFIGITGQEGPSSRSNSSTGNQTTISNSAAVTTGVTNRVYPNPPADGCVLWTTISMEDVGQSLCVFGLVHDSYTADSKRYFLRFNKEKNSFRMVLMNGIKMESAAGECVFETGEIKAYKEVLYMEFSNLPGICKQ